MDKYFKNNFIRIALLSGISTVLMFIEFPLPLFPIFLKFDFSDLPAIIGAFAMGPLAGILIELIKNILHGILLSSTLFVGELANFMVGSIFVGTAGLVYKYNKSRRLAICGLVAGTVSMGIGASILNYFIFLPLYEKALGIKIQSIIKLSSNINKYIVDLKSLIYWTILPFNLLKGLIISVIAFFIYKKVSQFFKN